MKVQLVDIFLIFLGCRKPAPWNYLQLWQDRHDLTIKKGREERERRRTRNRKKHLILKSFNAFVSLRPCQLRAEGINVYCSSKYWIWSSYLTLYTALYWQFIPRIILDFSFQHGLRHWCFQEIYILVTFLYAFWL